MRSERPSLFMLKPRGAVRMIALIAHGGCEVSQVRPSVLARAAIRMYPFSVHLARAGSPAGLLVAQLRYRVAGYNEGDPVADVAWAITELTERFGMPIALVGHSMGARSVLRAAGAPGVRSVAALAPWCPPGEPMGQLAGRTVMLVHGLSDRVTRPEDSRQYAALARHVTPSLCRFELRDSGHAMVKRPRTWHMLTRSFVLGTLGVQPLGELITSALALSPTQAIAVAV